MTRERHVRICERLGVQFPGPTRPPRSPNLNAYAERWVRSVKEECLAKLILLGEGSLRRALRHYEPTIMRKEITKAKTTYCYSLCRLKQSVENRKRCGVGSGWAAC